MPNTGTVFQPNRTRLKLQGLKYKCLGVQSLGGVWVMADFGQTDFGQTEFDLCLCVCVCVCVCVCLVCVCVCGVLVSRFPRDRPSRDHPFQDPFRPQDRPSPGPSKISLFFFFPVPTQNSFFSSFWVFFSLNFWWCLEDRGAQMCTFGGSRSCEAPAAPKPPGFRHRCGRVYHG